MIRALDRMSPVVFGVSVVGMKGGAAEAFCGMLPMGLENGGHLGSGWPWLESRGPTSRVECRRLGCPSPLSYRRSIACRQKRAWKRFAALRMNVARHEPHVEDPQPPPGSRARELEGSEEVASDSRGKYQAGCRKTSFSRQKRRSQRTKELVVGP